MTIYPLDNLLSSFCITSGKRLASMKYTSIGTYVYFTYSFLNFKSFFLVILHFQVSIFCKTFLKYVHISALFQSFYFVIYVFVIANRNYGHVLNNWLLYDYIVIYVTTILFFKIFHSHFRLLYTFHFHIKNLHSRKSLNSCMKIFCICCYRNELYGYGRPFSDGGSCLSCRCAKVLEHRFSIETHFLLPAILRFWNTTFRLRHFSRLPLY